MGPLATCAFYRKIILATRADRDQDHLHVIVDSESGIPDRTAFLLGEGPDPRPALIESTHRLVDAGCELLAMPCNTAHAFAGDMRAAVSVPLLDWVGIAAEAMARDAPRSAMVGVLATRGTLRVGLYQAALSHMGLMPVLPTDEEAGAIMDAIYGSGGVKGGTVHPENQRRLIEVAALLVGRGASRLILGCTELPLAVAPEDERWPAPASDPAVANARAVVLLAGGELSSGQRRVADLDGSQRSRLGSAVKALTA
jgi:aspartate racemase